MRFLGNHCRRLFCAYNSLWLRNASLSTTLARGWWIRADKWRWRRCRLTKTATFFDSDNNRCRQWRQQANSANDAPVITTTRSGANNRNQWRLCTHVGLERKERANVGDGSDNFNIFPSEKITKRNVLKFFIRQKWVTVWESFYCAKSLL